MHYSLNLDNSTRKELLAHLVDEDTGSGRLHRVSGAGTQSQVVRFGSFTFRSFTVQPGLNDLR